MKKSLDGIATGSVLIVFLFLLKACAPEDGYRQQSHRDFLKEHRFNIGQQTLLFRDTPRQRPLKTEVWYPTRDTSGANPSAEYPFKLPPVSHNARPEEGHFPLIIFSHGTGGNRISQMWLAAELAGEGFVVAAVDHWGNTHDNKIPESFVKIWERPADVSYLLNRLPGESLPGRYIDTSAIGVAGFSLGGYTALALAGAEIDYGQLRLFSKTDEGQIEFNVPELGDLSSLLNDDFIKMAGREGLHLKDNRIKAFFVMAPALGQGFTDTRQMAAVDRPVFIIGAAADERTPVQTNACYYHQLITGSRYAEIDAPAGHYVFMNEARAFLKRQAPRVFTDAPGVNRREIHKKVARRALDFFNKQLKKGGEM